MPPGQRIKQNIQGFLGVNLRKDRLTLADAELAKSINADLHEQTGAIVLRRGRRQQYATALGDLVIRRLALVNGLRYQVAGQSVYRDQTKIIDGLLSPDLLTTMQPFRPLADGASWLYIADRTAMYKDDGTRAVPWGIAAPPVPTVAIGGAGTGLSGTYLGGYTYLRHNEAAIAHESNAAKGAAVTLANNRLAIGNMKHPSDSQVTGLGVYRSVAGGAVVLLDSRKTFPTERTTFSVTHGWEVTAAPGGTDADGLILHWTVDLDTKRGTQRWEPVATPGLRLISQKAVTADSMTLPTHQAGDLIVMFAFRDGSTTAPSVPSGWTTWGAAAGGNGCSSIGGYLVATSAAEASGQWSAASALVCHVYRGQRATSPIGGTGSGGGSGTTVTYPALTMTDTGGTSLVVGFAGHRSTNTRLETAPTGMENDSGISGGTAPADCEVAGHETEGFVTSWPATNVSVGGTGSGWRARTLEIRAETTSSDTTGSSEDANGYRGTHLWEARETNEITLSGSDLITNGTFDTGISGWTDISTAPGSVTWSALYGMGLYEGTPNPGRGIAQQAITTVSGTRYRLEFYTSGGFVSIRVGSTSGGSELLAETNAPAAGTTAVYFTATGATSYVQFLNYPNISVVKYVDNVSCYATTSPTPIVTTQTNFWAYSSIIADSALGTQAPTTHDVPPPSTWVTEHHGHLFVCGDPDNAHHLRWSNRLEPERFNPDNLLEIGNPDDPLQCAVPIGGILGVFSRATKYRVLGNTTATFVAQEAISRRGTTSPLAVIPTEYGIVFPHHDGIFRTNLLQQDEEISGEIAPLFYGETVNDMLPINWLAASTFAAAYRKGRYYFAYASGQATTPDRLAVYSRTTGKWYFFDHPARSLLVENGDDEVLTAGFTDGFVYVLEDGASDAGAGIALDCETKDYFGGDPDVRKLHLWMRVDADTDGASLSVDMFVDGALKRTATVTGSRTKVLLPFPEGSMGFTWRAGFRYTGTARPRIYGVSCIMLPMEVA